MDEDESSDPKGLALDLRAVLAAALGVAIVFVVTGWSGRLPWGQVVQIALLTVGIVLMIAAALRAEVFTDVRVPSRTVWFGATATVAVAVVLLVARWAGHISGVEVVQLALLLLAAVGLVGATAPLDLFGREGQRGDGSEAEASADPDLWFVPLAVVLAIIAVALAVVSAMAIVDLTWDETWPWLVAGVAVVFVILALMAISFAPPGPNWIHRIAGIDGSALLIMAGTAVLLGGTYQLFTYDTGQASSPLWIGMVAGGLLLGLLGISRSRTAKRSDTSLADTADAAADRARDAATRAGRLRDQLLATHDASDPVSVAVSELAERAADRADEAEAAAEQVAALEKAAKEKAEQAARQASEAGVSADRIAAVELDQPDEANRAGGDAAASSSTSPPPSEDSS